MKNPVLQFMFISFLAVLSGCGQADIEARGFSLPEGDVVNGRQLFVEYHCLACHSVEGSDFSAERFGQRDDGGTAVELGGTVTKVVTYGDLVTSIINPSHRIAKGYDPAEVSDDGESKMEYYNEVMTVAELIDIVTFLKDKYEVIDVQETVYPYYVYP